MGEEEGRCVCVLIAVSNQPTDPTKINNQGDFELKTRYVLSVLGVKLEYYVRHVHRPSVNTLVWTLDYDRHSDFGPCVSSFLTEHTTCGVGPCLALADGMKSRVFVRKGERFPVCLHACLGCRNAHIHTDDCAGYWSVAPLDGKNGCVRLHVS